MKIIRAQHLGMCFGVRDAINLALDHPQNLTILGELVHNQAVLKTLKEHGVQMVNDLDKVETPHVMITAHGTSQRALQEVRQRGLGVTEATCPLVRFAHDTLLKLVRAGYYPVIIGRQDHVEVRGLTGDLDEFSVVLDDDDVLRLPDKPRLGVAAQTTQPIDKVRHLVRQIEQRFPQAEVRFADTVCQPTKQRQSAAIDLAQRCDVVVVIGGASSNNTRELMKTCQRYCAQVFHVQSAAELRPDWFGQAEKVGITAGTSTPDGVIEEVEKALQEMTTAE